jgi:TRAP-type C4-dicarboxylate transport system permease small subunit
MDAIARFSDRAATVAGWLGGLVLLAIMALSMVEVLSRYVFRDPLILSDELGGYAMVAVSFLGLAFCARDKGHIRITFLVERMRPALAGRIRVVTLLIALAFIAIAAWVSWKFLGDSFTRDMRSNSLLRTPLKWPQMTMPIGFTLFALVLAGQVARAWRDVRAGRAADQFKSDEF